MKKTFFGRVRALVAASIALLGVHASVIAGPGQISGSVRDSGGPVAGAIVRIQGTAISAVSRSDGTFVIDGVDGETEVHLTGWAPGYYIGRSDVVHAGSEAVEIALARHHITDDPTYRWILVDQSTGEDEGRGCAHCHSRSGTDLAFDLPVDEWRRDAHSRSGTNPRFLSMYFGTDLDGNQSPITRYRMSREYGPSPIRPDPEDPYFGPGYRLDFPNTTGNCAACHMPMAAVEAPYGTDPSAAGEFGAEGIGCDFCHKIWRVRVDSRTGLPFPNTPGVLSFDLLRPGPGHQLFIGPLDDVAPGEDTYSALQRESALCAPCHFATFWSTVVYGSYSEWLDSPYSDPVTGQTCQDCHMPNVGGDLFARPEAGGLVRDPAQIRSHLMPGAADAELLRNTVEMTASARLTNDTFEVDVAITNVGAGHYVPTDSPLRHLILVVRAVSAKGKPLELLAGERVPAWGGTGEPRDGAYAGLPGTIYARVLEELSTHEAPTAAYWNPTRVESDTRIAPLATATSSYTFEVSDPGNDVVEIDVVLFYRRAFRSLMELKGWDVPDVVMARHTETIRIANRGNEQ